VAVLYRDGTVLSADRRAIATFAQEQQERGQGSVTPAMAFSISARIPLWHRIWNKIASSAFVYVLVLRGNK
jgi:hypothetical protein